MSFFFCGFSGLYRPCGVWGVDTGVEASLFSKNALALLGGEKVNQQTFATCTSSSGLIVEVAIAVKVFDVPQKDNACEISLHRFVNRIPLPVLDPWFAKKKRIMTQICLDVCDNAKDQKTLSTYMFCSCSIVELVRGSRSSWGSIGIRLSGRPFPGEDR